MTMHLSNRPLRAIVLSPTQCRETLAELLQLPDDERHALLAVVPSDAVTELCGTQGPARSGIRCYETPGGRACAMLWLQHGGTLLRFLVALGTLTECNWLLEGLQRRRFLIALDVESTGRLVVAHASVPNLSSARAFAHSARSMVPWPSLVPQEQAELLADLGCLVQDMWVSVPDSVLPGIPIERSYLALAGHVEVPIATVPRDDASS